VLGTLGYPVALAMLTVVLSGVDSEMASMVVEVGGTFPPVARFLFPPRRGFVSGPSQPATRGTRRFEEERDDHVLPFGGSAAGLAAAMMRLIPSRVTRDLRAVVAG
jgi:hypothetical protein